MNGRRKTVRECAQKNGKIDENCNEDKEEIDGNGDDDTDSDNGGSDAGSTDTDNNDNNNNNNNNKNNLENEVTIMGIERQVSASDQVESIAPKQISMILNTMTVTTATIPNAPVSSKMPKCSRCFEFCRIVHTYQRQINSVSPGFLFLMATSFQIIWALNLLYDHRGGNLPPMVFAMIAIYYVGVIIGTVVTAFLISIMRKRTIHDLAACIGLLSCLLFQVSNGNELTLFVGRLMGGCYHGLIYMPTIVHAAENSSKHIRHITLLLNNYIFGLGIIIAVQMRLPPYTMFTRETLVAVHMFVVIVFGIVTTHIFTKESPIFLLQHQKMVYEEDLSEAYDTFTNLQRKNATTDEIEHDFDEIKTMLANEAHTQSANPFTDGNLKPLLLCGCCRLVALLSFNLPLIVEVLASEEIIACDGQTNDQIVVSMALWFCGGLIAICVLHYMGKKHLLYLYSTIFGISLTFVRILFIFDLRYSLTFYLPAVLMLFYFYIVSLPLEIASNIYLSEAFATPKKPFALAIIVSIEHSAHLLLLILYVMRWNHWFLLVTSLGLMGLSFKVYWKLPRNTNSMSLQQSVYAFRTAIVREWYSQANINSRCVV